LRPLNDVFTLAAAFGENENFHVGPARLTELSRESDVITNNLKDINEINGFQNLELMID